MISIASSTSSSFRTATPSINAPVGGRRLASRPHLSDRRLSVLAHADLSLEASEGEAKGLKSKFQSGGFARHANLKSRLADAKNSKSRRYLNRGKLRLFLDTASEQEWERFADTEMFIGITSNPIICKEDKVTSLDVQTYRKMAKKAISLGYSEVHLQLWGLGEENMFRVAEEICAIDRRVYVKVPANLDGFKVASRIKGLGGRVNMTAVYTHYQALTSMAIGADYVSPYLHLMNDAGREGEQEILDICAAVKSSASQMKVLAACIRTARDVTQLAAKLRSGSNMSFVSPSKLYSLTKGKNILCVAVQRSGRCDLAHMEMTGGDKIRSVESMDGAKLLQCVRETKAKGIVIGGPGAFRMNGQPQFACRKWTHTLIPPAQEGSLGDTPAVDDDVIEAWKLLEDYVKEMRSGAT